MLQAHSPENLKTPFNGVFFRTWSLHLSSKLLSHRWSTCWSFRCLLTSDHFVKKMKICHFLIFVYCSKTLCLLKINSFYTNCGDETVLRIFFRILFFTSSLSLSEMIFFFILKILHNLSIFNYFYYILFNQFF